MQLVLSHLGQVGHHEGLDGVDVRALEQIVVCTEISCKSFREPKPKGLSTLCLRTVQLTCLSMYPVTQELRSGNNYVSFLRPFEGHYCMNTDVRFLLLALSQWIVDSLPVDFFKLQTKQEDIALWTGIKGNGSINDGDGTIWHGLTMDIAKDLSIPEHMCYACIDHFDAKARRRKGFTYRPVSSTAVKNISFFASVCPNIP